MKIKLLKRVLLLAALAALPLVQGCDDETTVAFAWMPAQLQGIVVFGGGPTAVGGGGASSAGNATGTGSSAASTAASGAASSAGSTVAGGGYVP